MEKKHKCKYCGALLSETNTVFVHISRYDHKGRSSNQHWICCKCWDNTRIPVPSIEKDKLPEQYNKCGNCTHLILKNYKSETGTCFYTHRIKSFWDRCEHEEEM